eukprot:3700899-Pleurochrysis_carterae.AAC.2
MATRRRRMYARAAGNLLRMTHACAGAWALTAREQACMRWQRACGACCHALTQACARACVCARARACVRACARAWRSRSRSLSLSPDASASMPLLSHSPQQMRCSLPGCFPAACITSFFVNLE